MAGAACVVGALLLWAQAAPAKPGYVVGKPSTFEILHLKSSNGYTIDVLSFGARKLALHVSRFRGLTSGSGLTITSATYFVPRQAGEPGEIRASLGKLGRIALRFRPSGPPEEQREPGCKGRGSTTQEGRYIGTINFRGERGFTVARASSADGQMSRSFRRVCKRRAEERGGDSGGPKGVSLGAYVKGDPEGPAFNVQKTVSRRGFEAGSVNYTASVSERRGRIEITRSAQATAESSTFSASGPTANPALASVSPPPPFSGTATFERFAGAAPTWSGNLSVSLPGRDSLPLTGPEFSARLCRDLSCACPPGTACLIFVG